MSVGTVAGVMCWRSPCLSDYVINKEGVAWHHCSMSDQKTSPFLRPQSAVGSRHRADSPKQAAFSTARPWTTHPRQRREVSTQKVLRPSQQLRQSHLKAVGRQRKESQAVKIVLGFPTSPSASLEVPEGGVDLEVVTMVSCNQTESQAVEQPVGNQDGAKRSRAAKRHPTFATWRSGSPHDSDEYNTDLEDSDTNTENKPRQPGDASGLRIYEEQCKKHGFVPVSFLRRHLGKRALRMRHHYLGGEAARPLANAFRHNTVTETVDLSDNYLQSRGASCLAAMLRDNTFIVYLNLSHNFIGSHGCAALADMLDVNTTLKTLNLSGNQLTDRDVHHFIEPLKNNMSLSSLDLSHNNLTDMAGVHLAAILSLNDGINDFDLSWNSIRRDGAVSLVNALKVNTVLEVLDVSWNGIGAEGAAALQQSLQANNTLKVLDLTNNRLDTKSALRLGGGLKNNFGLETLILNLNPIGDEGIEAVLNAAAVHRSLKFLSLENCGELGMSKENMQRIQELTDKGLVILHGLAGRYHRNSSVMSVLKLFSLFSREHLTELEAAFYQQDKEHQGVLSADEIKQCLRTAGLRLTSRQLDLIIEEIDYSHCGRIHYREILSGKVFDEYHRRRPSRGFALSSMLQGPR